MSPNAFANWTKANQEMVNVFQDIAKNYVTTIQDCMTTSTQSISKVVSQKDVADDEYADNKHLKTGFICYKNITNANREAISRILNIQINALDLDSLAVLFRELTDSLNNAALKEIDYQPVSAQRKDDEGNDVGMMGQMGRSTAAAINFKNLNNSLMYRLAQQEAALGAAYLEAIVLYVKKLRDARVIEDVFGAQTLMLYHIQNQVKESAMDSISSMTAYKAGVNVWTEGVIESIPAQPPTLSRLPATKA